MVSERRKEVTKYCPESSSHGEVLVAAADLVCVRCGLLRRLRSRRACVIESRTVGGRRMKRTPACSERWKVCLTVCTQFRSPSLHSLGRDGSAPLRPEAQTCPQTRSLMGCLHTISSLVVTFTARFGVKLLMRFASIRFYSHSVASRGNEVVHSMELCLVPEHSAHTYA